MKSVPPQSEPNAAYYGCCFVLVAATVLVAIALACHFGSAWLNSIKQTLAP